MTNCSQRLLICYVPGLDLRRVSPDVTPNLAEASRDDNRVSLETLPSTELVPSLVTGVLPHQHRVWQVSLKRDFRQRRSWHVADLVPDVLTTTIQCSRHFLNRSYDLAALPWRRRRRFDLHRFKYTRRSQSPETMMSFGGYESIFGLLKDRARYVFTKDFGELDRLGEELPRSSQALVFLEMYALDLTQHWHLDNKAVMADALGRTDRFFGSLRRNCREEGVCLVLLVDHGQEPISGTIPLLQELKRTTVSRRDYTCFVELASARFWFHTDRARQTIMPILGALSNVRVFSWQEMHQFGVCFDDEAFGEYYVFADAGKVFFPHDFYQPIGNAFLGLADRHQRQRLYNPVHRGNHGYLPYFPSEKGWIVAVDQDLERVIERGHIIDVAPTLLRMAGITPPVYMTGRNLFHRRSEQ